MISSDNTTFTFPLCNAKKDTCRCHKCRHKPLVEFINNFQVHVVTSPHLLIDKVKCSMGNELVQMSVVVLLQMQQ